MKQKERITLAGQAIYLIIEIVLYWKDGLVGYLSYFGIPQQIGEVGLLLIHVQISRVKNLSSSLYRMFLIIEVYYYIIFAY
jgi:hypothetical protein